MYLIYLFKMLVIFHWLMRHVMNTYWPSAGQWKRSGHGISEEFNIFLTNGYSKCKINTWKKE